MLLHYFSAVQNIYGDRLLTVETSDEKKKGHWWQHHNLWPNFFWASSADRTPKRLVVVVLVQSLVPLSDLAWGTWSFRPTYKVNPVSNFTLRPNGQSIWRELELSSGSTAQREAVSLYIMLLHLMQPTLNTAKDSKDIMLNLLKFPTDWWLYDPVNKNNTEPFSEGGETEYTYERLCSALKQQFPCLPWLTASS